MVQPSYSLRSPTRLPPRTRIYAAIAPCTAILCLSSCAASPSSDSAAIEFSPTAPQPAASPVVMLTSSLPGLPGAMQDGAKNPLMVAIAHETQAERASQTAQSSQDWDQVARLWIQAITWIQAVPVNSPQRPFAQKKLAEYLQYLTAAQTQATATQTDPFFPSFNSSSLDEKLPLYLSYIAAVGVPDVLIIGSSRALQGIDPKTLQQALIEQGYPPLRIFNLGINGATNQVVNLLMQKILTPEQLPRLILWADGLRSFNDGRRDRTYTRILQSPGYRRLLAGDRPGFKPTLGNPPLPSSPSTQRSAFPVVQLPFLSPGQFSLTTPPLAILPPTLTVAARLPTAPAPETATLVRDRRLPILPLRTPPRLPISVVDTLDPYGFLPASSRFDPSTYYRRFPRVPGSYDGDYIPFQLDGAQTEALTSLLQYTRDKAIPVVFINLPLSPSHLDPTRRQYEQRFREYLLSQSLKTGFLLRDLSQTVLTRDSDFADPSHINRHGAAILSQHLAMDTTIPWPKE